MNPILLNQLQALLPLLIAATTAVIVMLALAFTRRHGVILGITIFGLAAALASLALAMYVPAQTVPPLLRLDGFAHFVTGLLLVIGIAVALLSYSYLEMRTRMRGEYYLLLVLAIVGGIVLASSAHFVALFLGLEILSVSLFALVSYQRDYPPCIEAGVKFLVLAGVATSILLFGIALLYAQYGTMEFAALRDAIIKDGNYPYGKIGLELTPLGMAGIGLVLAGAGFKLALAPFHLWTPDVYEGAPAPVTAFIATISKGGMLAVLVQLFAVIGISPRTATFLTVLAIASMFAGNLLGLLQGNLKRMLAYSSIANMGYLLLPLLALRGQGTGALLFYLVAYFATLLGAFGILAGLSGRDRDADEIEDYTGLAWRRPWLAAAFTILLLSLIGIPLTAGFVGKFIILVAGIGAGFWLLAILLVINSAISLFYYVRIIVALYSQLPADPPPAITRPLPQLAAVVIAVATAVVLALGVFPGPLLTLIDAVLLRR